MLTLYLIYYTRYIIILYIYNIKYLNFKNIILYNLYLDII